MIDFNYQDEYVELLISLYKEINILQLDDKFNF